MDIVGNMARTTSRREVLRPRRLQVALAVDGLVEHSPAAPHRFGPQRINALKSIGGDPGTTRELTEVASRDFGVGMIERIVQRCSLSFDTCANAHKHARRYRYHKPTGE